MYGKLATMRGVSTVSLLLVLGIASLLTMALIWTRPLSRYFPIQNVYFETPVTKFEKYGFSEVLKTNQSNINRINHMNQSNEVESATLERRNIFFLKAHKCASSTVQNILMRFGLFRNLDFVLPQEGNYLGNPAYFSAHAHIPPGLTSLSGKYNIFTHHTRVNRAAVEAIMPDDTAFVTILRNPADLYESLYNFYHLEQFTEVPFKEIFTKPETRNKLIKRFGGRIGINQMAWDLGYPDVVTATESGIERFILDLNQQYHLVMISEYMEASLVLLCRLMKWPLTNVVNLKLNSRPEGSWKTILNNSERELLYSLNSIDKKIYDFFLDKFKKEIISYGVENMKRDVNTLLNLNNELWINCVDKFNRNGYAKTVNYDLRNNIDRLCVYSTKNELSFTEEIRTIQRQKFQTINRLNNFLS